MTLAIETHQLTRFLTTFLAVDGIELRVECGTFYGFLGPNGAGKSTTIKMLTGLLAPSRGQVLVLGKNMLDPKEALEVTTVIGNRPQFIKAAAVSPPLRRAHEEVLVHTGQHFDDRLSAIFFAELGLPAPERELGIALGSASSQTARMLAALEPVLGGAPDAGVGIRRHQLDARRSPRRMKK